MNQSEPFIILIPVALDSSGPELLRLARAIAPVNRPLSLHALHLVSAGTGSDIPEADPIPDKEPLRPLLESAEAVGLHVEPLSFVSTEIGADITEVACRIGADLILLGWYDTVSAEEETASVVHYVSEKAGTDVGVYLCRQFRPWKHVLVPFDGGFHDRGALSLAGALATRGETHITILHIVKPNRTESDAREGLVEAGDTFGYGREHVKLVETDDPVEAMVQEGKQGYDLVIVGASESWGMEFRLFGSEHERFARECPASLLVLRKHTPEVSGSNNSSVSIASVEAE